MNDPHRNLPIVRSPLLTAAGVRHAFFTRNGGVSPGVYATLNGGVGSSDSREHVAENRRRMALTLGVAEDRLLVPFQIHSPDCLIVDAPWTERPRCDGLATATPGLALGVTGADCGMILFADISLGMGGEHLVMRWPMIWWTVGVSGHALTVAIVELVGRFHRERGA